MDGKWCLVIAIVVLAIILICLMASDGFKDISYAYKLPILGKIPNLQLATLPKMNIIEESSSEESSSEESSSEEMDGWKIPEINGWKIPEMDGWKMPEQCELLENLYKYEKINMKKKSRFGVLRPFNSF